MPYATGPISSFEDKVPVSTDILPIVDTTDPFVKNKKSTVANIFKAVPYSAGTTAPAIRFGNSNNSGIYSPDGTQVGVKLSGTSSVSFKKNVDNVTLKIEDSQTSNLDLVLQSYGSGQIKFNNPVSFTDQNFTISSSTSSINNFKFDLTNVVGTNVLTIPAGGGTLVTETSTQTLTNKTISNGVATGTFTINTSTSDFVVSNNKVGIGIGAPDYKLHVANDIKISGQNPTLRLTGITSEFNIVNSESNSLDFVKVGQGTILSLSGSGISISTLNTNAVNYTDTFSFIGNGTTGTVVTPTGVGIGLTVPLRSLDIVGAARISDGLYRPDNSDKVLEYNNSTTFNYARQEFRTGSGSTLPNAVITSTGNVGIGVSQPTLPLEVNGRSRISNILYVPTISRAVVNTTISGGVLNLDLDTGSVFAFTHNQNITQINYNFSKGTLDANQNFEITLIISHDGTARSINWGSNVFWLPVGSGVTATLSPPTLQSAGAGTSLLIPSRDYITLTTYASGDLTSGAVPVFIGRMIAQIPAL